ncbi:hypothetical protein PFMC_05291 [Plasmodium falciparum CAMP/Malaysia]|uniref:Erythrocyte membrane protein 1, PfEMP1 n=1 Tax=Plasmodium falciparum (isolate Camp / Malaysia) TaxID=5835 RepID=A0A024X179_PLAFC|nr:hypothetical protein PFMC_05291 [Plasmodium falciparum CAMP/Malaysia]
MHRRAKTQMRKNSVVDGDNKLEGNISKAYFKNSGKGSELKGNICKIDNKYSNDIRGSTAGGPCTGKDGSKEGVRMKIGNGWTHVEENQKLYKEVYLPPRREHMCTSNLENLDVGSVTKEDKAIHSLLGDVLLTAKMDAEKIKSLYIHQNGKKELKDAKDDLTICRAVRYSFADLGDIIRGRDMWNKDKGSTEMETRLKNIFKNIKSNLPREIQEKYKDDEQKSPQYKQLREDWWEANRHKVWKAMQCALKNGSFPCKNDHTPLHDYIPQRLRWMKEWSEWYCKMQSQLYGELQTACKVCKEKKTNCFNNSRECTACKGACDKYKKVVGEWEKQWEKLELEYTLLYWQAKITSRDGIDAYAYAVGDKDKPVVAFLQKLQKEIKNSALNRPKRSIDAITTDPTTPYSTAAGYIHQEAHISDCQKQTRFCKNPNGETPSSGTENKEYAFREKPHDHDDKCGCDSRTAPVTKKEDDACEIVKKLLGNEKAPEYKEACDLKYEGKKERYTQWNCTNKIKNGEKNDVVCIPPRRQKLYLGSLEKLNGGKSQQELRTAFIKCAAVETFFAWHEYKVDKAREDIEKQQLVTNTSTLGKELQDKLERGDIPPDFLRQMFYTLGDYRDIVVRGGHKDGSGKEIVVHTSGNKEDMEKMKEIQKKIKALFPESANEGVSQPPNGKHVSPNSDKNPQTWWERNAKDIWDGMLCALSYDTKTKMKNEDVYKQLTSTGKKNTYDEVTFKGGFNGDTKLTEFVTRPTFFRWFEEWGEEFCRERAKRLAQIKHECMDGDTQKYSGDGEDCKGILNENPGTFKDLVTTCPKSCSSYRKWIERKGKEFEEQSNAYKEQQKQDAEGNNNGNEFSKTLKSRPEAKDFLKTLGPCSKNNSGEANIDFGDKTKTFVPATNCGPCSEFKINCKNGSCSAGGTKEECKDNKITAQNFETMGKPTKEVVMRVSDNGESGFNDDDLNEACGSADIFKSIRKDQWKCRNVCGYVVCKPENGNGKQNENQIILINALLKRWVEYFLEDYKKIKKKLKPCIENGNGSTCINGCNKKCNCVGEWIKLKKEEWQKIKKHYLEKNKEGDKNLTSLVKNFLEPLLTQIAAANDKKKSYDVLEKLEKSLGCKCSNNSPNREGEKSDIIDCMLKKLEDKIGECEKNHPQTSDKNQNLAQTCENSTPPEDDEEPLEDEQNTVGKQQPSFSPPVPPGPPDACKIVGEILKDKNGRTTVGECNPKTEGDYPPWKCGEENFKAGEHGACMPPRRQKLCIHDLKELRKDSSKEELREAFIKCAAIETYFSWHYYKSKKRGADTQKQLNEEKIPDEFKKIMYYTFADYKDICLGKDISSDQNIQDISKKVKDILNSQNGKTHEQNITPETWWEKYGHEIWEGMLCALEKAGGNASIKSDSKYQYNKVTFSGDNSTTLEEFASRPQFLRWFTEWGEEFCKKRKEQVEKLEAGCKRYECNNGNNVEEKKKCAEACEAYKSWLQKWKDQYEQQSAKFDKEKKEGKYRDTSDDIDTHESYSARDYLHDQLEKLCTNGDCKCMENSSIQDEEIELSGINDFPEALDYPPKKFVEKCKCAIPPEPMSCVERTAQQLRKIAHKNIETKLKENGNTYKGICKSIEQKDYMTKNQDKCTFKKDFLSSIVITNNECESKKNDRFKIGGEWDCNGKTLDGNNKLCIPPRRKNMCLKMLEDINAEEINNSNDLLIKIQYVAQNEGDDIIYKLLSKYPCNESVICDAMKYSFADLGDIIRGRTKIRLNNGDNIEDKLKEIFTKLKSGNSSLKNMELPELREKWWDANRKSVWKAMTCNVPNAALLKKRINNPGDISKPMDSQNSDKQTEQTKKCGHNSEPPDYDYIPERYRFLQEWSEYYCKALKEKNNEMKSECKQCKTKHGKCENDKNDKICEECNKKCEKYKEFVDKWKSQFDEQNQLYKELYMNAKAAISTDANSDSSIKFIQKLDKMCEDPHNAKKYLDKSTHCTDYKFSETNNNENDAFSKYPNEYEKACTCQKKSSSDPAEILKNIIQNSFKSPKVPGLNTIKKAVAQIPRTIKNIRPDAHTIHAIVARSFDYFVPLFQEDDKTPPTNNILNDVLPSAIPVGIALALTSIAFLYLKVIYICGIYICAFFVSVFLEVYVFLYIYVWVKKKKIYIYIYIIKYKKKEKNIKIKIYIIKKKKIKKIEQPNDIPNDIPNDYKSGNSSTNTNITTTSRHNVEEKPFITSIHDRDLYSGEEYNYDMSNNSGIYPSSSNRDSLSGTKVPYSGIDLINDTLSGNKHIDIYDELLKRKENELFGTNNPKHISSHNVTKSSNSDPILNQINLFHKWLDRHRDMCEQWNNKEEVLDKLKEEWNKDNNSGNINPSGNTPPTSDIPSGKQVLNTDVSIQIDMDDPKTTNEFTYVDSNPNQVDDTYVDKQKKIKK